MQELGSKMTKGECGFEWGVSETPGFTVCRGPIKETSVKQYASLMTLSM